MATRVIKARRRGVCPTCKGAILPGQSIAKVCDPHEWIHLRCVEIVRQVRLLERELGGQVLGQFHHGGQ